MDQSRTPRTAPHGFTLVEVMVGLVLGMIAIIVMYQVFAVFEGQRRTTVAGGDAQTSGHLSMYNIERNLRLAGLGLIHVGKPDFDTYDGQVMCAGGMRTYSASTGGVQWADGTRPVAPIRITDGGSGSDAVTAYFGPSALSGAPATLAALLDATTMASGIRVRNAPWIDRASTPPKNGMFKKDDYILVAEPGSTKHCVRLKISAIELDPDPTSMAAVLKVDQGSNYDANPPPGQFTNFLPVGGYAAGTAIVTHVGGGFAMDTYTVNAQQLLLNGESIAEGVVAMKAQFGVGPAIGAAPCVTSADAGCQSVSSWTSAITTGGVNWGGLSAVADLPNIERIKAVRVAIVTRSELLERDSLYGAGRAIEPKGACLAAGDVVNSGGGLRLCAWRDPAGGVNVPLINLTGAADWDRYRYRVYETVIPLRNVLWGTKDS